MPSQKSSTSSTPGRNVPSFDPRFLPEAPPDRAALRAYEAVLAEGLKGFLNELAMINGAVMVSYICNNQHAHLEDIIASSMERRIKPGRLSYANHAEIDFDWGEAPSVALAMELRDDDVTAFFHVVFGGDHVGIEIRGVHFATGGVDGGENLRRFSRAVADARLSARGSSAAA